MANCILSAIAKGQVKLSRELGAAETRSLTPSVMALAMRNSDTSISAADKLRIHENRVVDINFFTKRTAGSAVAKTITHTGTGADTNKVNLVYASVVETFSLPAKLANNNIFSADEMLLDNLRQCWQSLAARQDAIALALALSDRCQLSASALATPIAASGAGIWNETNYALEISEANRKLSLQKAKSFMRARYFNGMYDVIADLQMKDEFDYWMNQGAGNNQNTGFQYGDTSMVATQSIISSDYSGGSFIIMPKKSLAGVCWNDKLNLQGVDEGQTATGIFTTMNDPFGYGTKADLSIYTNRADTSADTTGGSTQDLVTQFELTLTMAYATSPLTTSGDGVPHLVGIVA